MKVFVKYAFFFIGILVILAGTSISLALVYRGEIVRALLASVAQNNNIVFETKEVNIVLSSNIKNAKLLFSNVEAKSVNGNLPNDYLSLQTDALGVEVNLLSFLLHREVKVEKISVANGSFLFKPGRKSSADNKSSESENLLKSIKHLSVENFLVYLQGDKGFSKFIIEKTSLHIVSGSTGVNTKVKGSLTFEQMNTGGKSTLPPMTVTIDASGNYVEGVLSVSEGKLVVDGQRLSANGTIALHPFGKANINVMAKGVNVEKTLPKVRRYALLKELEAASGRLDVAANLSGFFSSRGKIKISAQGSVSNGGVRLKNVEPFTIHSLNYSLHSDDIINLKSYHCDIQNAGVTCRDFELGGSLLISSFTSPTYDAAITFNGDLKTLKLEAIPEGKVSGSVNLKISDWSYLGIENLEAVVSVSKLRAKLLQEEYILDGELSANKESTLPKISIASKIVNGSFEGKVQNYLPSLLDSKKPNEIKIVGALNADKLDLDKLFLQEGDGESALTVRVGVDARAKEMLLFGEHCLNSSAKVFYDNSATQVKSLKTNVYGGLLEGDLNIYTPKTGSKRLNLDLDFNHIEIPKLTFVHQNFKLKTGSILGECTGAISLNSNFDEKGLDFQNAFGSISFTIENGRLVEFEPIQPLQGYIKKKLLQDVKFSALRNTISMEGGEIIIPRMEIRSSALNTYVSGKQMVNGDFDYHLTLFVSELLRQKNRDIENPIRDDKTKLFLRFTSKNGKKDVSLDSQEWGKNVEKKMQREADEIRANSKNAKSKDGATSSTAQDQIIFEWEEQPLEEKKPETPKREEKKKPQQKPEVQIEWDE